jgi:hypothetical protein
VLIASVFQVVDAVFKITFITLNMKMVEKVSELSKKTAVAVADACACHISEPQKMRFLSITKARNSMLTKISTAHIASRY